VIALLPAPNKKKSKRIHDKELKTATVTVSLVKFHILMQTGKWIMHVWKNFVTQQLSVLFGLVHQGAPLYWMQVALGKQIGLCEEPPWLTSRFNRKLQTPHHF